MLVAHRQSNLRADNRINIEIPKNGDQRLASDKQIAANRANAQKGTGPKTAAGKLKSCQNARRHGLSIPLQLDAIASAKAAAIALALIPGEANESGRQAAEDFAHAQLELERIRVGRVELMGTVDPDQPEIQTLRRLASLDRYERYNHTKRREASRVLETGICTSLAPSTAQK